MLDIILMYNLPYFVILAIPIIISELFFKENEFYSRFKSILFGFVWITIGVFLVNIILLLIELLFAGSFLPYLLSFSYTGTFNPSIDYILIRTFYLLLEVLPIYILFISTVVIARTILSKPTEPEIIHYEEKRINLWFYRNFADKTALYNNGIPMVAVIIFNVLSFMILIIANFTILDISYIHQLPKVFLQSLNSITSTLFFVLMIYIPLRIMNYRLETVEKRTSERDFDENIRRFRLFTFGIVTGGLFVVLILSNIFNEVHNYGESLYSGKVILLTIIFMAVFVVVEIAIIMIALNIPMKRFNLSVSTKKVLKAQNKFKFRIFIVLGLILLCTFTVIQPIITATPTFETNKTAFSNIEFSDNPIENFPVNLSQMRLVPNSLARDISKASPSSPPKPYSLTIMDDKDMVGMINGTPSWIIPMKYESQFNPDANVIAGYVRVHLDDPIPEHIQIKFFEMKYGWGLNGFNDIHYRALEIMPDAFIGDDGISFVDPYKGEPVWILKMSKYNQWGLEIPAGVLVIKGDGTYEKLTLEEASVFDPEIISDSVFMATAKRAGNYIRTNQATGELEFDFSARGLFTVPRSPDRFLDIGIYDEFADEAANYYLRPHHYLLNDGNWYGRMYYRKTTTSNIENIVVITVENKTMTLFDLREYERGGLRGVHSPDDVMDDLEGEFSEKLELKSGESLSKFRVIQPTLYKTSVDNDTVLVWVSLIIYNNQGADELRGALFIDAANTRIVGYTTRSIGEPSEIFKQRLVSNIEQTYLTFGTENDTAGETQTAEILNGTVIHHDWIGQDVNNWKIYVMRIWDNEENKEWRILVRKSDVLTGQIYALAASAMVGEQYRFSLRFDKDEQVYILYDMGTVE